MKRLNSLLALILILILPLTVPFSKRVQSQDCYVQIVSLTLDQSALEIGETLQMNLVYDLFYDPLDPLGIGAISVTINIQGKSLPLSSYEYSETGLDVTKSITFEIVPNDWQPNDTGEVGLIQVEGWVQDSVGTMTDSMQQQFSVQQSNLLLDITPLPSQITFHDELTLSGTLQNPNNTSLFIPNHPLAISVIQQNQTVKSWNLTSTIPKNFTHYINSTQIGTGLFDCQITAYENDDYKQVETTISFGVSNSSLTLSTILNTTTVQAYYPSANNYSILVSSVLDCQSTTHTMEVANLTCTLGNITKTMTFKDPNQFSTELLAPTTPGNYFITITAIAPYHNVTNSIIPILVVNRQAQMTFQANQSMAAYNDIIGFSLNVIDESSQLPLSNKTCSIFLNNQSVWNFVTQVILDQNGNAEFSWQAQNIGNQDFRFKATFSGFPEFANNEKELTITNTHEIRIHANSTIYGIRQTQIHYMMQITTVDYQPIANVTVQVIQLSTNTTWCTTLTNNSGFATLTWYHNLSLTLGIHELQIVIQNSAETLSIVTITLILFEQTILELV